MFQDPFETPSCSRGVIILSGGMDSVTLLHHLVHNDNYVEALSFNYGQKHSKELGCAKRQCYDLGVSHTIIDLPFVNELFKSDLLESGDDLPHGHYEQDNMKQTVVPNRNMIMSAIAVGYASSIKADFVALGVHSGDHAIYPDCRKEFVEAFASAVKLADWEVIQIVAPFIYMDKKAILEIGLPLGVDYSQTWTCYEGKEKPEKTGATVERAEAFLSLGIKDPLFSDNEWDEMKTYLSDLAK